jgi:hypothetical protein
VTEDQFLPPPATANTQLTHLEQYKMLREEIMQNIRVMDPYFLAHPRNYRLLAWGKALPRYQVTL